MTSEFSDSDVILGNSNPRFSGVTSTMLQTLEYQHRQMKICVLGRHHLPENLECLAVSFWHLAFISNNDKNRLRVFHARRNDEMIQALLLRNLFGLNLKIVFTSTAQRHHSRFTKWLVSKMDCVISTCKAAAAYLDSEPFAIVPHGVRTDIYRPRESRSDTSTIKVGLFGRVRKQKGSHLFVEAMLELCKNYSNVEAHVIGAIAPDQRAFANALQERINSAGLQKQILIHGEQPFKEIPRLFGSMDVICALSENEGFGLTILEAMSSGTAVIATEAGAWPEIIEPGVNGWVIPVNARQELITRLQALVESPEKIKKMGAQNRTLVLAQYRVENEANALCEIYKTLLTAN